MALFQETVAEQAYLKMGIYGNSGSGKTYTATKVAIGLVKYIEQRTGKKVPIMFLDTETGSAYVRSMVVEQGIQFLSATTRAFVDLQRAVREAEALNAVMIVDSITHFWDDIKLSFAHKRKRRDNRLEFQDYGVIKPVWGQFTQAYLTSRAHIILCGRAGNTYEYQETVQDDGRTKKDLITTGTKMKAESEMGYEPSLLVEMFAEKLPDKKVKKITNKGFIWKDRWNNINGHEFSEPTFDSFLPHIRHLNIGGEHIEIADRDSQGIFDISGRPDWQQVKLQKEIVLEEIQNLMVLHVPGQAAADKQRKITLIRDHFNATWKEMEEVLKLEDLRQGYETMHFELEKKHSRYFEGAPVSDDEIPDFEPKDGFAPPVAEQVADQNQQAAESTMTEAAA